MKRLLPLLVIPFLALACTDREEPALLEPADPALDVTIQSGPVAALFTTEVYWPQDDCTTLATPSGLDWVLSQQSTGHCLHVEITDGALPVTEGAVTFYYCDQTGSGAIYRPAAACTAHEAQWVKLATASVDENGVVEVNGRWPQFSGAGGEAGYYWVYRGQGSGFKNYKETPFNVIYAP